MKGTNVSSWTDGKPEVTITGTNDGQGSGTKLISGKLDSCECDWERQVIHIEGRSKIGELIDANTDPQKDQFKNKTAEEVVKELASRHGMQVESDGAGQKAGRKHVKEDYDLLTGQESVWNVIRALAEREGKVVWGEDKTLHFKDPRAGGDQGAITVHYRQGFNGPPSGPFVSLRTSKNFTVSDGVSVDVNSWHTRDKKDNKGSAGGSGGGGGGGGGQGTEYKYEFPGLTQEQSENIAKKRKVEHTRHGKKVTFTGPGDTSANVRMTFVLSGTGTDFDDTYDVDSIRWIWDGEAASFSMTVEAKMKGDQ